MLKKILYMANLGMRYIFKKPIFVNLNVLATNRCSQKCPMCNAYLEKSEKNDLQADAYAQYLEKIKKYKFLSCTISGGEPTLNKNINQIIALSKKVFPYSVSLITNLYGNPDKIANVMEFCLTNNVNISISFDGFDEVGDKLRGAKNVSKTLISNLEILKKLKKETNSKSNITLHTVISNENLAQVPKILDLSKSLGFNQSVAPVNSFFYTDNNMIKLDYSKELETIIDKILNSPNVNQNQKFIKGIIGYSKGQMPKVCPYTTKPFYMYKVFLETNGDITLCDRRPIGNIMDNMSFSEMMKTKKYEESFNSFKKCKGCWIECFTLPMIMIKKI